MTLYKTYGADLVREIGTANQVERLQAGVLPEQEFDNIIRRHLFRNLGTWPRFKKIKPENVKELAMMRGRSNGQDRVLFETIPADELTSKEWADLQLLEALLSVAKDITAYWTVGTCGEHVQKFTKARITIDFHGRIFQQEVRLG